MGEGKAYTKKNLAGNERMDYDPQLTEALDVHILSSVPLLYILFCIVRNAFNAPSF